jgi:hypothetical protein
MWIVFEMASGLLDELAKVIGPFDSREAAESYCILHDSDGVMEVEAPE